MFHIYERKRNPWGRNTKVWKLCENFAPFSTNSNRVAKIDNFRDDPPLENRVNTFDLQIIDIELQSEISSKYLG